MTKEEIAQINMELIAYVGAAKSSFLEAIDEALTGNLEVAKQMLECGQEDFNTGHSIHARLLTAYANNQLNEVDLLTVHAQCQLMSAEDFLTIAKKVIAACDK